MRHLKGCIGLHRNNLTKTRTTYNIFFLLLENGKEILSMNEVLSYLLKSSRPLIDEQDLSKKKTLG
jgi:hypothetical protein